MHRYRLTLLLTGIVCAFAAFGSDSTRDFSLEEPGRLEKVRIAANQWDVIFHWSPEEIVLWKTAIEANTSLDESAEISLPGRQILIPFCSEIDYSIIAQRVSNTPVPHAVAALIEQEQAGAMVEAGDPVVFRDIHAVPLQVRPYQRQGNSWFPVEEIRIAVRRNNHIQVNGTVSPAFLPLYRSFLDEDELDELGVATESGGYIIVGGAAYLEQMQGWLDWKRQCGFPLHIIETGASPTFSSLRSQIETLYHDTEPRPEYLLLVGDPHLGPSTIPGDYVETLYYGDIITDHHYVTIDGNDEFPEMLVGRWSVVNLSQLLVLSGKSMDYEKGVYLHDDPTWTEKGVVICDNNYNSVGYTTTWLRQQMLENGYTQVDSFWAPPTSAAAPIINSINQGRGWVSYRGFGSTTGWTEPNFHVEDLSGLTNDGMTPFVTGIVCGCGRFDDDTDPCLGEAMTRMGTVSTPTGAVGFIGPTEIDTHTRWNNCNVRGIFTGVLWEGVQTMGAAMLRGKMNIWNNFPGSRDPGYSTNSARFYFDCYNLLGDPGVMIRTGCAISLQLTLPDTLGINTQTLATRVTLPNQQPVENARVTVFGENGTSSSMLSAADGFAWFDVSDWTSVASQLKVTAVIRNGIAVEDSVMIDVPELAISLDDLTSESPVYAGEMVTMTAYLSSVGSASGIASAVLQVMDPSIEITGNDQWQFDLDDPVDPLEFTISIPSTMLDGYDPGLTLLVLAGGEMVQVRLPVVIQAPCVETYDDSLIVGRPGDAVALPLIYYNNGHRTVDGTFEFTIESPGVNLLSSEVQLPQMLAPGDSIVFSDQLIVSVDPASYPGDRYTLAWEFTGQPEYEVSGEIKIITGAQQLNDPYGPDSYGYRAFDNTDTCYWHAPLFDWFEINPYEGGCGVSLALQDFGREQDASTLRQLPFDFTYYGETYNQVTICSNGWLVMGETDQVYYLNWPLDEGMTPPNMIAPLWDDLNRTSGDICVAYDEEGDRYIIEWSGLNQEGASGQDHLVSLQAVLYNPQSYPTSSGDGIIDFYYLAVQDGIMDENGATVGIRNRAGDACLQLRYYNDGPDAVLPFGPGTAYRFATGATPDGFAVRMLDYRIFDDGSYGSGGDGDGNADNGDTLAVRMRVKNYGAVASGELELTASTSGEHVLLLDSLVSIPALEAGESVYLDQVVRFKVDDHISDGDWVRVSIQISDDDSVYTRQAFSFEAYAPSLKLAETCLYDDPPGGNGNGRVQAGEDVQVALNMRNSGRNDAGRVTASLGSHNDWALVHSGTATIDAVPQGQSLPFSPMFDIEITDAAPMPTLLQMPLTISIDGEVSGHEVLELGIDDGIYYEPFGHDADMHWYLEGDWHISSVRAISGNRSLRWGDQSGMWYTGGAYEEAVSDTFRVNPGDRIEYWANYAIQGGFVLLKLIRVGQDTIVISNMNGFSNGWVNRDRYLQVNRENMLAKLQLRTTVYYEDGTGTGFHIDDIHIYNPSGIEDEENHVTIPEQWQVLGPYPNPFNPETRITLAMPVADNVSVDVFDVLGRHVTRLEQGRLAAGYHELVWKPDVASGIYFMKVNTTSGFTTVKKLTFIR